MADPTKVYTGGIPTAGFSSNMQPFGVSKEAETTGTPGGPATRPGVVNEGGATQPKTYDHNASAGFLDDPAYNTVKPEGFQARSAFDLPMKTVNPDDISNADHC